MRGFKRKRRVLLQYACGTEYQHLLGMTKPAHAAYCARFGIGYRAVEEDTCLGARGPYWRKVELMIEAFRGGYDQVAWLDADCIIVDASYDIFAASGFGIAACECFDSPSIERHLNCGVIFATNSPDVRTFLDVWYAMPTSTKWPGRDPFPEQDPFIDLMATRPHRDLLTILPNRFNCIDVHMDARDPVIRAFHGDQERVTKITGIVGAIRADQRPMNRVTQALGAAASSVARRLRN